MAQLILPSRRIAQPQGAVEIDRANRYGAAHLYGVAGLTAPGSSVDGVVLSNTGGVTRSADVIDFTGVAGNRLTFPSTPSRIGQQFTIIARVKKRATNRHDSIFDTKRVADWDTNYGFAFNLKDDGGALFKVGASEAYTFTNYTNNSNWHVLAAVYYAGTKQDIYIDGAEVSYYFHAISSAHNPLSNALICGAYYDFSSNRTSNLLVEYAHIFDGAFTLDEINKFARQPWQIFKPRNNRIYFDVGAGGT
ncbi:MAG: hypothetical protein QG672_2344, partial [Pseudomonadota bacterium]|nr:hypothetical protein [Pseudomonadota bacterium]